MTPIDTQKAEQALRTERENLLHQLEEIGATADGSLRTDVEYGDGFADAAATTAERTEVLGLAESLTRMLEEVDLALARIEEGSYGTCRNCGNEIAAARLEFRPESTLCVDCKSKASSG
jgi:RNA polymerase-binding protein DksA